MGESGRSYTVALVVLVLIVPLLLNPENRNPRTFCMHRDSDLGFFLAWVVEYTCVAGGNLPGCKEGDAGIWS